MNTLPEKVITELKRNEIILTWDSVHRPGFTYTLSMELKVCDTVLLITRELMETPFTRAGIFLQFHIPAKSMLYNNMLSLTTEDLSLLQKTFVTAECKKRQTVFLRILISRFPHEYRGGVILLCTGGCL